ncbi:hypothetical protein HMPREF3136_11285 [Neisseria sp. HMSC15C08]|uniref:hypothetical protein n=1 Tax=Neisseria mucosa TaxID=488 RepID=UPI0008A1A8F4|nr:hypothetical protein [Neisseria mucosa]OFV29115.1 hypothetical protein HMPREF3136_11285 [Neisseria sp. HMSC15C08]
MVLDFVAGVLELFVATWDFLSYGKKRISVLRRAYRHGGRRKVRRVLTGRKMEIAVWLVFVMILAAGMVFAWTIIASVVWQAFS